MIGILESRRTILELLEPNTFIGGVGADLPTSDSLRAIIPSIGSIVNYSIINNNVSFFTDQDYVINSGFKSSLTPARPTYFIDKDGYIINVGGDSFFQQNFLNFFEAKNVEVIGSRAFYNCDLLLCYFPSVTIFEGSNFHFYRNLNLKRAYFPLCSIFGTGGNSFQNCISLTHIYVHPDAASSNGGSLDASLANSGATIIYVTDFTPPSAITDLDFTVNGTDIDISFTPPASTNTLDFYEIYKNGFYHSEIITSPSTISGLANGDKIKVYACDEFYNRSGSNEIIINGL